MGDWFLMIYFFYFFIFALGLIVGSFLNVVILRLDSGQVLLPETAEAHRRNSRQGLGGRSHCPKCGRVLKWYDLVPVLSFVLLARRCRYCKKTISWQYPLVELATGALFLASFKFQVSSFDQFINFQFLDLANFLFWAFIGSCLIVIFVFDLRHYIIPDKIVYPAIIAAFLFRLFEVFDFRIWDLFQVSSFKLQDFQSFGVYLLSAFAAAAFFLAIVLITLGKGMGVGDIKLAFLMGLLLGWPGIALALFLAFFSGAALGLLLIALKRKTLKSQVPFGPFLALATLVCLILGNFFSGWWQSVFDLSFFI